jgi:Mn-dependent DtxR family transcriptional regulator
MVQTLAGRGYLVHVRYRGMKLTDKGEKIAKSVISRHNIILEFLTMIGVDKRTAYRDAEGIEHYVQPTTISKIEDLVKLLRKNPRYLNPKKDHVVASSD